MKLLLLVLVILLINAGCRETIDGPKIKIPDLEWCKPISKVSIGADCIKMTSQQTRQMTGEEFIQWLNASSGKLPAVSLSGKDAVQAMTVMEQMCTKLKSHCTLEMHRIIESLELMIPQSVDEI